MHVTIRNGTFGGKECYLGVCMRIYFRLDVSNSNCDRSMTKDTYCRGANDEDSHFESFYNKLLRCSYNRSLFQNLL